MRRIRWMVVALVLVVVSVAALLLLLARGTGHTTAGRPVPEPAGNFNHDLGGGLAPRAGDLVITISPEKLENAHLKIEGATASSVTLTDSASLRTTGTVQSNAYKEVPVWPVVGGIVRQVDVELGDRVRRGQKLATIFSNELSEAQATYLGMQAEAERHHQHFARTSDLVELGAASREELEQATAEAKTEAAKLNAMRERLILLGMAARQVDQLRTADQIKALVSVEAPASGTVLSRSVNPGEVLMSGKELFRIADLSTVWVIGQLYERDFAVVRLGSAATITTPSYPEHRFTGKVSYVDPRVDPQTRTAQVRVEVANPKEMLKLGMFVDVSFSSGAAAGRQSMEPVLVPREAVQMIGSRQVVYVVTDRPDSFVQREVSTGGESGKDVLITGGLSAGDKVVTEGSFLLRGESLKVNPSQSVSNTNSSSDTHQPSAPPSIPNDPKATSDETDEVQSATVRITGNGYEPAVVRLRRGVPARLTFVREIEATCSTEVVIADFGIKQELPFKQPVVVEIEPRKAGRFSFSCGMNMLHGKIVVR